MPNIPDHSHILYPTGLVLDPKHVASGANGTNVDHGYITVPFPGLLETSRKVGTREIDHPGVRGTITAEIVTGAAGANVMVVHLSDGTTDNAVLLYLDTQNRPGVLISAAGVTVATWAPGGSAIAEGVPLQLKLVWNSETAAFNLTYLDGSAAPGSGSANAAPWGIARFSTFQTGWDAAYTDFNGTVNAIQVGFLVG